MSALRDAMSHAALGWVKPELDQTLRQARNEIEYFAEEPSDTSRMRFCAGYLHQVQGTLRMVELYAPAMVAEELELLAQAVQVGEVADRDEACAMLMRGTVLLPDYLERLQNGHRDIPIVLLPLLNEIRATWGQPGLNESVLFALDPQAGVATEAELDHARGSLSGRNRELLDTVGNAVKEELLRVKDALDLHLRTGGDIAKLQTQVKDLGSVADTLGMMGLGVARNVVVQQRDALARVVDGQTQMDESVLLDIAGALLYVDASLDDQVASLGADPGDGTEVSNSANSSEVRRTVDVLAQQAIANFGAAREHFVAFIETNWDHARLATVPHLLGEVGGALRILELPHAADYLEGVRRYVDLELIGKQRVPSGRQLDTLADAMASLEYYLEALRERRPGREEILDITRNSLETLRYWPLPSGEPFDLPIGADQPGSVAEPQTVAAPPLQHADTPQAANDAAPTPLLEWVNETVVETPFAASVVHDTGAAATDAVFSFDPVAAEETVSGQSHVPFTLAPLDLSDDGAQAPGDWQLETTEQVAPIATSAFDPVSAEQDGTEAAQVSYTVDLSALEQEHAAEPVVAEDAPLQIEQIALPGDAEQTEAPLDFIAENATRCAQTSIEDAFSPPPLPPQELDDPFVEPVQEPQDAPSEATAEATASRVQQAVVSEFELDDASAAFLAQLDAAAAQFDVQQPQATTVAANAETAQASSEPVSSEGTQAATAADAGIFGGFGDSDIDDDIRDVFLEEFDEELVNLGQLLPVWRGAPNNPEHLRPIRRVFHTLKGSGRLVGASVLGEFSWKIESMLNRVLDNSRPASPALVAMVELAYDVLPQFNAALRNQGRINADLPDIQAIAERVAAGEEVYYVPAAAASVADAGAIPAATSVVAASGGTPASVDSVLREILEAEVATHLDTVNGWLQASQAEPQLATEELLRAVHTMSGAFAMTDVPEITLVTTPAESYVKRLLAASVIPSAAGLDAIAATVAAIATTVTALRADAPLIPSFAPLTERLRALVDTLPEAQWPPQVFLDELDDVDAPSDTLDDNNVSVELTGAHDLSQYLDASALPFDAPAPVQDTEDTQPQSDDAPIAVDALAEAEAEHDSALALDAPASHAVDDVGHLASHEHVDASAESAHASSDDALVPAVVSAQLADAISTHADTVAVESVQAFEMAHAADQVEEAGDPQSDTAPELHDAQASASEDATHADAHAAADAIAAAEHVEHAEHAEHTDASEHAVADQYADDSAEHRAAASDHAAADHSAAEPEDTNTTAAFSAPVEEAAPVETASNEAGAAFDIGSLNFDQLDGELVDIFVEEGRDLLDHSDGLIARMREVPEDRDVLNGLQRDLHTLKGGARMAGINAIGDLGHAIESLLEAVAANRTDIDRDDVRLFERGFDRLHQLLTRTGMHRAVAMPTDLVEAFETRTRGRNAAPPSDADVRAIAKVSVEPAPLSAPVPVEGQTEEDFLPRVQQEQVRVRADLLDRLVNHAGEVAIYRSRLEQQLGAFRGAMGELDRTNTRLRDQLRRLDLETEAQIVARYQREQDQGDRTFDPLELDRFSTLQQLSRALNESAADLGGLQGVLEDLSRQYDGLLQQQSRVSSELQDGLMRARMVPFDGLVPRLRRVVRQAASDTGKQVHLLLEGTQGELDRNVLDRMVAPLEHMLRNSVAHGLETPEQRRDAGKPEEGSIAIRLRREGSEIVLEVADDGAGLDREAIRRRGEQRGLIEPGQELSDAELDGLIFASGFSTSEQVSQLAGRGVGMDVVRNEVRQVGGSVDIHSVRGQGVTFTLRLPQTLAVTQAVFVRIGETTFAVPVGSVSGIGRISRARYESGEGGYHYAGEEYVLHDLGSLVGQAAARADGQAQVPLLLVRAGDLRAAVAIDQVLGNREIVVKPVGLQIASVPGIYGATITGDGRVVVILDVAPLVRRYLSHPARQTLETQTEAQRQVPLVMVVDDSLTMRKVTGRVLERHNLDVTTARDGVEALELLEERVPDLMLLDIEMPRMDGYELATAMRADPRFKAVPIVMITSRSGEKHRQRAFQIGVERYLGKPYQELDLMRNVYDMLGIARVRD
ncbi:hypothetical protein ADT26_04100 [Xanthomonas oryzae]|uniref:Hpt domain-containing protein n=1 Tax=Xanthomonas oryzae TaxID=347 RepID=UPI0006AC5ABF|nr:Hpt domain-containing protein [Xanthomonas oryzae]ALS94134.1 hypothetical protein AXO1947_05950 [Xanthomonas oryzae pv. oryzae]AVU03598.1 hybrid sensor histidine kinase/response regulator [Xanthomonas oryzae pv. oryzae]KOR47314.1 hypothetical protein ADT26_04100 [Xanthomonas oryzae]QBI16803.1 response regulator [Xanthomonas oryzae pv. oryzae]QBN24300.1 response regulator [Xanthomonas oryzae pv. oryzae]